MSAKDAGGRAGESAQDASARDVLERRYRRLLAAYPGEHRRAHGEEMLGVLLAGATERQRWPGLRDAADLILGALRIRMRQPASAGQDARWADALAVLSVIMPLLLCTEAIVRTGLLRAVILSLTHPSAAPLVANFPAGWPLAAGGPAVLALALLRLRRTAGLAAVLTLAGLTATTLISPGIMRVGSLRPVLTLPGSATVGAYGSGGLAITALTCVLAAAALLLSPGPDRGLRLLRWRGTALAGVGALVLAVASLGLSPFAGYYPHLLTSPAQVFTAAAILFAAAYVGLPTPAGRRILVLLAVPGLPYGVAWLYHLAPGMHGFGDAPPPAQLMFLPPVILAGLIVLAARARSARARSAQDGRKAGPDGQ